MYIQDKPPVQPSAVKGSLDKLDVKKLFSDVKKYSSCGVPQDKMSFWISLEDKLTELAKKSLTETEQYQSPLELLLRKERRSTAQKVTVEIPDIVSNALEKDTLPIPEVYIMYFMFYRLCIVNLFVVTINSNLKHKL